MDLDKLLALGFDVVGGQIDRLGVNYGSLTPSGVVLTPEGEELVKSLTAPKRTRKAASADEPVADAPAE